MDRDGRQAGFIPSFATRPGDPGSGSEILNSGFRAGFVFASGFRVPGRNPGFKIVIKKFRAGPGFSTQAGNPSLKFFVRVPVFILKFFHESHM